jgi:hypothetical protein
LMGWSRNRHSGRCEASNPESRDSGFSPAGCSGMTGN